jgi:tetratricopeptide (TPR) repeat protein/predicted Ser/Thr protein kinase
MAQSATGTLLASRYRTIGRLGSGGMATVFLAEDERLGRRVAIKRLHADSPADTARRFGREARIGASLNHPNLVMVFDTVTEDETVLIVMEYVDGETLADAIRRGPLDPGIVAAVACGVAAALDHAHEHGIVHRDVKPANVLIGRDGSVKLVDLGIATALEGTRITASGSVMGTAAYMAPEQLDGRDAGPRADVYALAICAYEMLTGRRAFRGTSAVEVAHQVVAGPRPDLLAARPDAPVAAAAALEQAMSFDPGARQSTAGEFARELARALGSDAHERSTDPIAALGGRRFERERQRAPRTPPPGPRTPPRPPQPPRPVHSRRRFPVAAVLVVLLCAGLAFGVGVLLFGGGGDSGTQQSADAKSAAQRKAERRARRAERAQQTNGQQTTTGAQTPASPAQPSTTGAYTVPQPSGSDPGAGAKLQARGHSLIDQGDPAGAIPVLEQSIQQFPPGTNDLNYAYALYDLGHALRLAGRPADAIPVLERRLTIDNQRGAVQTELDAARAAARG